MYPACGVGADDCELYVLLWGVVAAPGILTTLGLLLPWSNRASKARSPDMVLASSASPLGVCTS